MSKLALPCIKCGKPLRNCDEDIDNQPSGGTEFTTYGHYGSTIHDEVMFLYEGAEKENLLELVVNICDTCILRAIDAGIIQSRSKEVILSRHPVTPESRAWVLAQNEKQYGSAWGDDEPVDYDAEMLKAGWSEELIGDDEVREAHVFPDDELRT